MNKFWFNSKQCKSSYAPETLFFMHEQAEKEKKSDPIKLKILSLMRREKNLRLCFMHKKLPLCESFSWRC